MTATSPASLRPPTGTPLIPDGSPEPSSLPDQSPPHRGLPRILGLDGLRALAVLSVMIYHADAHWLPGGFLGVDVFFVLSGFLITSLLLVELETTGRLDFRTFYVRRARRLLPAVLLLLLAVTLIGAFWATDAAAALRRDIPAALAYATNWVYVFSDQSYFEAIGRPPLLQHLWSLAVEEQFYLIWPVVAYAAFRRGTRAPGATGRSTVRQWALIGVLISTGLLVVISLLGGYPVHDDGSRAYFGTDTHAMGLLIGAALATAWIPWRSRQPAALRGVLTLTGLAAIAAVVAIMMTTHSDSAWLYRGGFLLFAMLVAVLIVSASFPSSPVGRVLDHQPMRYIGQRSYGLYLWHWPVFLVLRPGVDLPFDGTPAVALQFAVTFALAELSYRFVEAPIRLDGFGAYGQRLARIFGDRGTWRGRGLVLLAVALVAVISVAGFRVATLPDAATDHLGGRTAVLVTGGKTENQAEKAARKAAKRASEDASAQLDSNKDSQEDRAERSKPALSGPISAQDAGTAAPGTIAIGESVMLGARGQLADKIKKVQIDAAVGRQAVDMVTRVKELKASGALRDTVILHIGSNGYVTREQFKEIVRELSGARRLVVVNVAVPRIWEKPNNDLIEDMVRRTPNAILADWHSIAAHESGLKVADGVHLNEKGAARYAQVIRETVRTIKQAQAAATQERGSAPTR